MLISDTKADFFRTFSIFCQQFFELAVGHCASQVALENKEISTAQTLTVGRFAPSPSGRMHVRPAVVNDAALSALAEQAVEKVLPGALVEQEPWMASESFAWYQQSVPGVFAFVGMKNETVGSGALHHNEKFDVDEACMPLGVAATVQFACDFLSE